MARFDGKPLISTKVSDGINKAQELIERALSGNAPVYHSKGGATEEGGASSDGDTIGRKIYKSLMNGVSHMLPFVIGGGILIALSFLVDGANAVQQHLVVELHLQNSSTPLEIQRLG